ncbi:unnamed protein product [Vicia faba]|uniref:Reverse transcriptase domain-containing protein n=1 Tax=Vicia faba TaxID=3906 RepID=A0AAV0ZXY9_VICFA|nr:unnamed protein product [Vicia faba]
MSSFVFFFTFTLEGELSKAVTSSFLTLVPKCLNPIGLDNYTPICLVGCMYKVVAKVLAGRLKRVLNSIISPCQSAFVAGRQLLDGVMVANQVVDYARKEDGNCLLFKVDFEKAYDKVEESNFTFLGIPIGINPRKASSWLPLMTKMRNRLAGWKNRFLNLRVSNSRFHIRNGFTTPFWEAKWIDDNPLTEIFPDLFAASCLKRVSVAGMGG